MAMAITSLDAKHERILRGLQKQQENRLCFNCQSLVRLMLCVRFVCGVPTLHAAVLLGRRIVPGSTHFLGGESAVDHP